MNTLIAVKSWRGEQGQHDWIRNSWGKHVPAGTDLRFFMGGDVETRYPDETALGCLDDYRHLPYKLQAILRWAKKQHYGGALVVDTDTFLNPGKFLASDYARYDYYGHEIFNRYLFGGEGYYLSMSAAEVILQHSPAEQCAAASVRDAGAEDIWIAEILKSTPGILINGNGSVGKHFPRAQVYNRENWLSMMAEYHLEGKNPVRVKTLPDGRSFSYGLTKSDLEY